MINRIKNWNWNRILSYHFKWQIGFVIIWPSLWVCNNLLKLDTASSLIVSNFIGALLFYRIDLFILTKNNKNMENNQTSTGGGHRIVYNDEMLSLFDYLGHPAGGDLGKAVAKAATAKKVMVQSKQVVARTYTGSILMYPKSFLEDYFKATTHLFL